MSLARTIFYCLRLRSREKKSQAEIQKMQLKHLRKLVAFAKENSPFYSNRYKHIDPDAPDFSVQQLPVVTKEQLMDNFDRVVTDPRLQHREVMDQIHDRNRVGRYYRGRFVITHTSGTTGTPGCFVYSRQEWDWIQALAVTRSVRYKPTFFGFFADAARILIRKVRVAVVSVLGGHFVTHVLFLLTPKIGRMASRFHFLSVVDPLPRLVAQLNEIRPNILHCYPTMLEILAYEQLEGRLRIQPWVMSCSSEPLTPTARKVIEEAFPRSPLYETYGTSEGVTIAAECRFRRGLHVNTDAYLLEVVDENGNPAAPGETGDRVYLTSLFSRTMPLLRYEISDVAISDSEPCPCGLPFPLLKVRGRTDDTFWVQDADGNPVALPPIPFEALLLDVKGVSQYQLVLEKRDLLRVLFRPKSGANREWVADEILSRLQEYLGQKGLRDCLRIEIEAVEQIPRHPTSGKIRQIYSKIERLYLPGTALGERRRGGDRRCKRLETGRPERRLRRRRKDDQKSEKP